MGRNVSTRQQDLIYQRTPSGDAALVANDVTVPSDYRRILGVIEGETHSDVIRGHLRQFPDTLLGDWLSELEEAGYVSSVTADPSHDLDFSNLLQSGRARTAGMSKADKRRVQTQANAAAAALNRKGAFLSPDRLQNRPPLDKKAEEITVLIVEDDPDQAALANLRVNMAGYQVRLASNCKQLVHEVRAGARHDVVLLDVLLPDGNGFDVLGSIRRHPKLALLPVVMLTALASPDEVLRGLAFGADGYITKPYSKKILTDTIRAVLKHS